MIRSQYGAWKGPVKRGLIPTDVLGKLLLVNRTHEPITYSVAEDTGTIKSDQITVFPGEALCFTRRFGDFEKGYGHIAIGPEAEVVSWVRYYFFEPHLVPDPVKNLKIENCFLKVLGVTVTLEVLKSYGPEVVSGLRKILEMKYSDPDKRVIVAILFQGQS